MSPHLQYMYSYIEGDFTLDDDPVHQKNLTGRPFSLAIVQFTKKTYQSTAILILLDGRYFYNSKFNYLCMYLGIKPVQKEHASRRPNRWNSTAKKIMCRKTVLRQKKLKKKKSWHKYCNMMTSCEYFIQLCMSSVMWQTHPVFQTDCTLTRN